MPACATSWRTRCSLVTQAWSELQCDVIPALCRIIEVWKKLDGREESRIIPQKNNKGSERIPQGLKDLLNVLRSAPMHPRGAVQIGESWPGHWRAVFRGA